MNVSDRFGLVARKVAVFTSSPMATLASLVLIVLWGAAGPPFHFSDGWQLVVNSASSVLSIPLLFILSYAQNRDTNAMNAKLDALIAASDAADNRMIRLERLPQDKAASVHESVVGSAQQLSKT